MSKRINQTLFLFFAFLFSISINAQNENDVVRYIGGSPMGTARYSGMAGAFGALGGDLTTPIINPAGSAIYRKSEISLTPGFEFNNVNSSVNGFSESELTNKFVFSNLGYVSSSSTEQNRDLYFNFSMGYSKTADYNRNSSLQYLNNSSSMLFSFTDRAYGIFVSDLYEMDPFSSYLAYETYLIDDHPDTPTVYTTQPLYELDFNSVEQKNRIEEKGSSGEIFFNFSTGIMEKVFLGATVSFIKGNYEVTSNFKEYTTVDSLLLDNFTFNYLQKTEISGADFKLGLIYKPEKWLRLGLAYHIPYNLTIRDEFSTNMRSTWKDGDVISMESPEGFIEYEIRKPGKWIVSAAFVSGFRGLLSLDVEWMNYGASKITSRDFDFSQENAIISETLRNTLTVRVGGELWLGHFNFRLGYAYRQNPYVITADSGKDFYNTYSGGVGILTDVGFFINLSLSYREDGNSYYPYGNDIAPLITDEYSSTEILLSLGMKF